MKAIILDTNKHFGAQLRDDRLSQKIKQIEIEKRTGTTSGNINHFEKGHNTFGNGSIQTVFKYARALGYDEVIFKL